MKPLQPTALIIGADDEKNKILQAILRPHCSLVRCDHPESIDPAASPRPWYRLVVISQPPVGRHAQTFFNHLKRQYPHAKLILIVDDIGSEVETCARATGTLFVGSLEAFQVYAFHILQTAFQRHEADPRKQPRDRQTLGEPYRPGVFFVDDDQRVLNSISRLLHDAPYAVHTFNDPDQALKAIDQLQPELVVSGYQIPGMSGIEFLEQVKYQRPVTVRIIMTGETELETVLSAVNRCQVYKLISKPWNPDALKSDIAEAIIFAQLINGQRINTAMINYLQRQCMERMNGVQELAVAVCHEMGQPLQAISGWVQLLLMDQGGRDDQVASRLASIRTEVDRLAKTLDNLRRLQNYRTTVYPGGTTMIDINGSISS